MNRTDISPAPRIVGPAFLLWILSFLMLLAATALGADAGRSDTGQPYLKRPAESPAVLLRQVAADRQLMARYSKHFRTGAVTIRRAFGAARPITLPPGRYTVWLTSRDGLRYPTVQERTQETQAFLVALPHDQESASWLEAGSGNPIEVFRPVEEVEVVVETPPARVIEVQVPHEILVPVGPAPSQVANPAPAP